MQRKGPHQTRRGDRADAGTSLCTRWGCRATCAMDRMEARSFPVRQGVTATPPSGYIQMDWRGGRAVEGGGLENLPTPCTEAPEALAPGASFTSTAVEY